MIRTLLTSMFGLSHPIISAPMGSVAGGALAAAVSNAGGLGMVGGGYGDAEWLREELGIVQRATQHPWGVGLITWAIEPAVLELALASRPHAFMLSFGDPRPWAAAIKAAGCRLICQVQDVPQAQLAAEAGADLVVAQGTEAGGHGGTLATLPLVPAVIDAVSPVPVIAAGGIADGRGVAAAVALGAAGALLGTRFYASREALGNNAAKHRIVLARGDQTARTRVFDIVRGYAWPTPYTGRALRNTFLQEWHGREDELAGALPREAPAYRAATRLGNHDMAVVWASEAIDLIRSVEDAGTLVERIGLEARDHLVRAGGLVV